LAWEELSVLAVVPARGGSKGIPRKNLRQVGGRSLIAWAAETVAALPWLDAAVLSTDDEEMADEGRRVGLDVPFMRPDEFATDVASSVGMWQHAWRKSEEHYGRRFDLSVLLQPTTPLRDPQDVERCLRALVEGGHQAAATVSEVPGHFVYEKCLLADDSGVLRFAAGAAAASRRQDAPRYLHRNGLCYVLRREPLLERGLIVEEDCVGVEVEGFIVNIDDPFELELAEFMHARDQEAR
jgi:CMP-N,N'-diacetyllegionaminic acid synthase